MKAIAKTVGAKITSLDVKKIEALVEAGAFLSVSDFVREAVRDKLEFIQVVNIRDVDYKTAKKEILGYFESKDEAYPSDAANDLELDLEFVFKIVDELRTEGRLG